MNTRTIGLLLGLILFASRFIASHLHLHPKNNKATLPAPEPNFIAKGFVQNPNMTPGDALTTDKNTICTLGYTKTVRNVPTTLKHQVYSLYGIFHHKPGDYEIDHLISLELGGSNSVQNLWPESFVSKPLNAHVKDEIENRLHEMICNGTVSVTQAQQEIASNWTAAYIKYIGPLPQ